MYRASGLGLSFFVVLCCGCSEDTSIKSDQAVLPPADAAAADQRVVPADSGPLVDSGLLVDRAIVNLPDSATADGAPCSGACAQQSLEITFGATTEPLERSIFGIDHDESGQLGIYLEALDGGFDGCPQQDSPTPDRTLIISGLPLPAVGTSLTLEDGLVVSLLDYEGTLLPSSLVSKATAATVTFVAADICPSCVGQPAPSDPDGFVALDLEATFPEGTISGHLYAVHCDSLDL